MTTPVPPAVVSIVPEPDSRLDQLAAAYPSAKAGYDAAEAHLKMITTAIKAELAERAPGAPKVDLNAPHLLTPLRYQSRTSWGLDTTKLKAEAPEIYVRYAKQSTCWELRAVTKRGSS